MLFTVFIVECAHLQTDNGKGHYETYPMLFGTLYVSDSGNGEPTFDSVSVRTVELQSEPIVLRHKHGSSACIELRIANDTGESLFTQHLDNPLRAHREVFGDTIRIESVSLRHATVPFRCPLPRGYSSLQFWFAREDSSTFLIGTKDL